MPTTQFQQQVLDRTSSSQFPGASRALHWEKKKRILPTTLHLDNIIRHKA